MGRRNSFFVVPRKELRAYETASERASGRAGRPAGRREIEEHPKQRHHPTHAKNVKAGTARHGGLVVRRARVV
jgi:hypothetical protein